MRVTFTASYPVDLSLSLSKDETVAPTEGKL